jgi:hypothetical protein
MLQRFIWCSSKGYAGKVRESTMETAQLATDGIDNASLSARVPNFDCSLPQSHTILAYVQPPRLGTPYCSTVTFIGAPFTILSWERIRAAQNVPSGPRYGAVRVQGRGILHKGHKRSVMRAKFSRAKWRDEKRGLARLVQVHRAIRERELGAVSQALV